MTTYFTPVGTLAELTRAKGSDINSREAAVTTGFTGIEAHVVVTTPSFPSTTNWSTASGNRVSKTNTSLVVLNMYLISGGSAPALCITLPVGYRPAQNMSGIACAVYDNSASAYKAAVAAIATSGAVTVTVIDGTALDTSDSIFLNVSFFNS